jgi:O-antigen ligase
LSAWPSQTPRSLPSLSANAKLALAPLLGLALLVRVLTDDLSSPASRHSGSLNLSAAIAVLFILVAAAVFARRPRGARAAALAWLWLALWTAVAVATDGASAETLREGIREASVVAFGLIVYEARGALSAPIAARLLQIVAAIPAAVALYQLASHTGMSVTGELRSNGTFAFPTSAAMFFAIAAAASLWRYLDLTRSSLDALLGAFFAAALIATFSIDGLVTLLAMLVALGLLRPGPVRAKAAPCLIAAAIALAFFATPLGSQRISSESKTDVTTVANVEGGSSLAWRLHKWKTLLPLWEHSPLIGRGLGTTLTTAAALGDRYSGKPPHNEYIRYLVETGIVGLALLLGGLALLIRRLVSLRGLAGARAPATLHATTLAFVVLIGCLVNALADNTFINSPTCYAAALIVFATLGQARVTAGAWEAR